MKYFIWYYIACIDHSCCWSSEFFLFAFRHFVEQYLTSSKQFFHLALSTTINPQWVQYLNLFQTPAIESKLWVSVQNSTVQVFSCYLLYWPLSSTLLPSLLNVCLREFWFILHVMYFSCRDRNALPIPTRSKAVVVSMSWVSCCYYNPANLLLNAILRC